MNIESYIDWLGGPENISIDVFRAEDQGVNENSRGVRVTHLPTKLSIVRTNGVLMQNKTEAIKALALKVSETIEKW